MAPCLAVRTAMNEDPILSTEKTYIEGFYLINWLWFCQFASGKNKNAPKQRPFLASPGAFKDARYLIVKTADNSAVASQIVT